MIAERLTYLRTDRGLSQQYVARSLHISRSAYSSYETGRRMPPPDTLLALAQFFRTTTDFLMGATSDPAPPPQLDPWGKELLRCYLAVDDQSRAIILRCAVQESLLYGLPRLSKE